MTILKGQEKFSNVLGLLANVTESNFPNLAKLFRSIGFAQMNSESEAKQSFKKTVLSAVVEYTARGDGETIQSASIEALFYYGFTQGKRFGVVADDLDVNATSIEATRLVKENQDYQSRYQALDEYLTDKIEVFK